MKQFGQTCNKLLIFLKLINLVFLDTLKMSIKLKSLNGEQLLQKLQQFKKRVVEKLLAILSIIILI